jgi:hypothetical protein
MSERDYLIRERGGTVVAIHRRIEEEDGKRYLWFGPDGTVGLNGTPVSSLPLYLVDRLDTSVLLDVVVVEGEKCADCLGATGIPTVGTVTGASATPDAGSLAALTGRKVFLWPDNDLAGRRHMAAIAERLVKIASSVVLLDWPDAPPGGDAADFLADHDRADVLGMIDRAVLGLNDPAPAPWPEPEDRGTAVLSPLGEVEYVEDLIRPGRIVVWAAEEGSGKSYTVDDELSIRIAVAGGSFAGTWPVLVNGPVLLLSEMHSDDDFAREETTLASLGLKRGDLAGRYFRLSLMTAANGKPALTVPEWRSWVIGWLRDRGAILLVIDTATGATQVDPWGAAIQEVFTNLRLMLAEYPALAIVLLLHLKKPTGRGERRISDVLGEWSRWNDVTILMENDGTSLERTKISVRKRVRHERRIIATKAGGLLLDPIDADAAKGTKVKSVDVLAVIEATPGIGYAELGEKLGVSKSTASNYVDGLGDQVRRIADGPKRAIRVFPTAQPPNTAEQARLSGLWVVEPPSRVADRPTPNPYIGLGGRLRGGQAPGNDDDEETPDALD